jgi:hypothetical protein
LNWDPCPNANKIKTRNRESSWAIPAASADHQSAWSRKRGKRSDPASQETICVVLLASIRPTPTKYSVSSPTNGPAKEAPSSRGQIFVWPTKKAAASQPRIVQARSLTIWASGPAMPQCRAWGYQCNRNDQGRGAALPALPGGGDHHLHPHDQAPRVATSIAACP